MRENTILLIVLVTGLFACQQESARSPKPRAYPKVVFPEKEYVQFEESYCDFSFEMPSYATIQKTETFFGEKPSHECWFDIDFPSLNGSINCSYHPIKDREHFDNMIRDAFKMSGKHNTKANARKELLIEKEGVAGLLFKIKGPVASPTQFFLTDTTHHFFRGSLYFHNQVNTDSMSIIYDFVDRDIDHLIETFEWD